MNKIFQLFIFISSIILVFSQSTSPGNVCHQAKTCGECVKADEKCAWCSAPGFKKRCDDILGFSTKKCPPEDFFYPRNKRLKEQEVQPDEKNENTLKITPQVVNLKLRPKSSYRLALKYNQSEDYPVDLYYLMDLSNSMKDDKQKLAELGNLFAEEMGKITTDFKLGFGSFVDKVVMPYTSTVPEKLKSPCTGCEAPYGFRNHMKLSLNTSQFSSEVNKAPVSGNLDGPEGGFDAIMQAIVCNDIGWRKTSRKLLVFSTDSSFHSAGDGKIGGIVKPNDGVCHLDNSGYYTQSSYQDYPSLSQINNKAHENKVNIIFAVTANQEPIYKSVSNQIEGATSGTLSSDSSNVVKLVRDQYDRITSNIEFRDTAPDFVEVKYYSKCLGDEKQQTSICDGLKFGDTIEIEAMINVLRCPERKEDYKTNFTIYVVPLPSMTVNLEVVCDCDCEQPTKQEPNSDFCNDLGTYQCGICKCNEGRSGETCECDRSSAEAQNNTACINPKNGFICSARGRCICGRCQCDETLDQQITGDFCECNSLSCDRSGGEICSGPENGDCECGICNCKPHRTGNACQCPLDTVCYKKNGNGQICEGHGDCKCGSCSCWPAEGTDGRYEGPYCETHPNELKECKDFLECVLCTVHKTGRLFEVDENCRNCSMEEMTIILVDNVEDDERFCYESDEDDCRIKYRYEFNDTRPIIFAQEEKICPDDDFILPIVIGVIVGIVLIGLILLLIWKLLTTIHDHREFAKFEKEAKAVKWDTGVNPLFKGATSTFKNPTYGGK